MPSTPLIQLTDAGFYCEAGGFHIDPWRPVDRAVITHAHADHARRGSRAYLCAADGAGVLRIRMGADAVIETLPYGETTTIGDVAVSLHPAGHLLGSAQVCVEHHGERWVVSGDYKVQADATCAAFEPVSCDVFISECTFGLPIYRWPDAADVFAELHDWWRANQADGRTSIVYAYSLGKAQRVLAGLDPACGPILLHGAAVPLTEAYRAAGVDLPPAEHANAETAKATRGRALVIAPPSVATSPWRRKFGDTSDAMASGWMQIRGTRRRQSLDRGFVISDHADWPGLHDAIESTGAARIGVTHGYVDPLARFLREQGRDVDIYRTRFAGELDTPADDEEDVAEAAP